MKEPFDSWKRNNSMFSIKALTILDYKSANDIYHSVFYPNSPLSKWWRFRNQSLSVGVFNEEGDLLAFSLAVRNRILYLAVHMSLHDKGIGTYLLQYLQTICRNQRVSILLTPAEDVRHWYCKNGFKTMASNDLYFHSYNTRGSRSKT